MQQQQQQQNNAIVTTDLPETSRDATVSPAEAVEVVPLAEVLRQLRRDAAREPRQYLDETLVPFGGE